MFSALGSNFSGLKRSKAKLYRPCNQFDILWYFDMLTCLVTVSMSCVCTVHEVTWLTFQKWRKKNLASHHKECRTESHCNNDSGLLSLLLSELVTAGDTWAWHPLLHSFCHNVTMLISVHECTESSESSARMLDALLLSVHSSISQLHPWNWGITRFWIVHSVTIQWVMRSCCGHHAIADGCSRV